jgi:hypothetical protein
MNSLRESELCEAVQYLGPKNRLLQVAARPALNSQEYQA